MFYRLVSLYLNVPKSLPSYRHEKFAVRRRARSPPTQRMEAFAGGGKFGAPAKKRSRRISTINRTVSERISLIITLTSRKSLSLTHIENRTLLLNPTGSHWPRIPVRGTWNEYSFTSSLLPKGAKGARLRTPIPLVSSGQRRCTRSMPPTLRERHIEPNSLVILACSHARKEAIFNG